jgi:hypothetical protein
MRTRTVLHLVPSLLLLAACGGAPEVVSVEDRLTSGNEFPDPGRAPETPVGEPKKDVPVTYPDGTEWTCTVQRYSIKDNPESFVTLNPTAAVIWPGSMLQGGTLDGGTPEPIAVKRGGGTVLMNLVNSGAGTTAKSYQVHLDEVTQGNVIDAQNQILSNNVGSTPAAFSFEFSKVDSQTQLALAMDAKVEWMTGSVEAGLKFSQDKHYTRYLVKLTQQYYTMVFQTPTSPIDLLAPSVTQEDLSAYVSPGNPATYVSSVTYGRQFYLLFESTASAQDVEASLKFIYNGGAAKADVAAQASYKRTESETTVKAWALGGAADKALEAVLGATDGKFDALHDYIAKGATFDASNPGLPLSYVVRYAGSNKTVKVALGGEYDKQQCVPKVRNDARTVLWLDARDISASNGAKILGWKGKTQQSNDAKNGFAYYSATGMNGRPAVWFKGNVNAPSEATRFNVDLGSGYVTGGDYTIVAALRTSGSDLPVQPFTYGQQPSGNSNIGNFFLQGSASFAYGGDPQNKNLHAGWASPTLFYWGHYSQSGTVTASMSPADAGNVLTLRFDRKNGKWIYMDGVMRTANLNDKTPLADNLGSSLGWGGNQYFAPFIGYLSEVRAFSYGLPDAERRAVECDMGQRWGIGVADCIDGKPDPAKVTF